MSTIVAKPAASVTIPGVVTDAQLREGDVSLDAGRVPYVQARVVLPLTSLYAVEALDPRKPTRGALALSGDYVGGSRAFDLSVQERRVTHDGRSLEVRLTSDEVLAQQYTPLTVDRGAFAYQASLRGVCDYVLSKVPGIRVNLVDRPQAGGGSGWGGLPGTGGAWTTTLSYTGTFNGMTMRGMAATWSAASSGTASMWTGAFGGVWAGGVYSASGYIQSTISGVLYRATINWYDAVGMIGSSVGSWVTGAASGSRPSVTDTAPAGATRAVVMMQIQGPIPSGAFAWLANVQLELSDRVTSFAVNVIQDGTADAGLTAYWAVTNLMPNPCVRGIVGNWIAGGSNGTLARMTSGIGSFPGAADVTTYTRTTWTGNSGIGQGGAYGQTATMAPYTPVTQGRTYRVSCWARANVAKTVELRTQVFGRDGTVLHPGRVVASVALAANTWTLVSGTIEAPPEAENLGPFLYAGAGVQWVSGNTLDTTCWMLYEDIAAVDIPFFDGSTPGDAVYTYAAVGAAHVSAAVRTPVLERLPDIFTWRPDTDAWAFVMSLAAASGFKLFCDETRTWRLVDPATYTVPGNTIVGIENGINPATATAGADSISRDDENWCTGIAIRWTWRDAWNISRERLETAGTAGRVRYIEINRPFPGPGLAAAMLARAVDQGRVQVVTALTRLDATPGMNLAVTLPGTKPQRARLASVEWNIGDALMTTTGRNGRTVPGQPAPVTFTALGPGTVTVNWEAPDNGGSPITGYVVDIFHYEPPQYGDFIPVASSPLTVTPAPGNYKIAVRAKNALGEGPWSVYATVTIP